MPPRPVAGAAAHSPDTAAAGAEILEAGGSAADAAVAMTLAACVAEPLVVSLLSGMHAIHVTPDGVTRAVDGFVDVPARTDGGRLVETAVDFGGAHLPYVVGGGTFGTPALLAGCGHLHARFGRLPWAQVVGPAIAMARSGVVLTPENETLLEMISPVMTLGVGAEVFCDEAGGLRRAGALIRLPAALIGLLEEIAEVGSAALYHGPLAEELASFTAAAGGLVTAADLAACAAQEHTPPAVVLGGWQVRSRRGLSPLTDWVANLEQAQGPTAVRLAHAQGPSRQVALGTTSLAAMDGEGGACAVTASLGLGTGDWFRGQQLNSMLGELELQIDGQQPRTRMGSMMAPAVLLDPRGRATVLGAAGGSRIPSAMLRTIDGITRGGLSLPEAVDLPRLHRMGEVVHVEPELPEEEADALVAAGFTVQRWDTRAHFFGGISGAGWVGAQGDPRRGGVAVVPAT